MSTNCRTLDEMGEAEAIEYVKLLIERIRERQKEQESYLARRAGRGVRTPTDVLYEQYIQLDSAVLEVLKRLVANP